MPMGTAVPLKSSNLESCAYDAESETLEVSFKNGGKYRYAGVPAEVYAQLTAASSPGGFFAGRIKDTYRAIKLA